MGVLSKGSKTKSTAHAIFASGTNMRVIQPILDDGALVETDSTAQTNLCALP